MGVLRGPQALSSGSKHVVCLVYVSLLGVPKQNTTGWMSLLSEPAGKLGRMS